MRKGKQRRKKEDKNGKDEKYNDRRVKETKKKTVRIRISHLFYFM